MKTQEETTTFSMLVNGECTDQNLLNQHLFIEKPDSQILNIKFVGPGLLMIDSMYSPINKQALQQESSTLVFGHNWYGWNDIENISTIATPYIAQHNITKLNIILQMHGFVEDNSYYLGMEYDPTAICGAPKKVLSNQFINELSKLTNLVESTDLISIACYGKKMIELGDPEIIQQFSNTTFCFFSKDDVTWQGDICNGSHQLDSFFQSWRPKHKSPPINQNALYTLYL
ncbi:hypothetical protein [Candidatus Trichorickettsia mobilis]|uniref:hypothetical protein n=1 Tax=Candidatus Trichorickettsia mobilis TaxID=1346319 RepID=UPI00292E0119|nr:hypothetical protein [Candidatus Trichorickettsia mobilis]